MKAYKQGDFSRWCSVYSIINAMNMLGLELPHKKAQDMYDYILEQLYLYDALNDVAQYGADGTRIEQILQYACDYLKIVYNTELKFDRPFYNCKITFDELLEYMERLREDKKAIIVRIRGSKFDHYSVFDSIQDNKLRLRDSDHLPYVKLNQISHIKDRTKFQLLTRQLYILELCK